MGGEAHVFWSVSWNVWKLNHYLDANFSPDEAPNLAYSDGRWNWDSCHQGKAQGLKAVLSSFQTVCFFLTTKNILDKVKTIAVKLQ